MLPTHPEVRDVAVVAMPDPRYGEKVCAFFVTQSEQQLSLAEVQRHLRAGGVAKQKTPEALFVLDELPRTTSSQGPEDRPAVPAI